MEFRPLPEGSDLSVLREEARDLAEGEEVALIKITKTEIEELRREAEQLSIDAFHAHSSLDSLYQRAKRLQEALKNLGEVESRTTP